MNSHEESSEEAARRLEPKIMEMARESIKRRISRDARKRQEEEQKKVGKDIPVAKFLRELEAVEGKEAKQAVLQRYWERTGRDVKILQHSPEFLCDVIKQHLQDIAKEPSVDALEDLRDFVGKQLSRIEDRVHKRIISEDLECWPELLPKIIEETVREVSGSFWKRLTTLREKPSEKEVVERTWARLKEAYDIAEIEMERIAAKAEYAEAEKNVREFLRNLSIKERVVLNIELEKHITEECWYLLDEEPSSETVKHYADFYIGLMKRISGVQKSFAGSSPSKRPHVEEITAEEAKGTKENDV